MSKTKRAEIEDNSSESNGPSIKEEKKTKKIKKDKKDKKDKKNKKEKKDKESKKSRKESEELTGAVEVNYKFRNVDNDKREPDSDGSNEFVSAKKTN